MAQKTGLTWRQLLLWVVNRNPTYLISACLMAVGSRLLLVGPSDTTGDIKLILATLAVLQFYEWSVAGILLVLHRAGRSPEDRPSLLLVASLFWTGPMAATIEMTALRPTLGTCLAAGGCLIAIGEMRLSLKALEIRLSRAGQIVAGSCFALLTIAAPLLKIPESNSGLNELYLYASWWVLAGLVVGCLAALRSYSSPTTESAFVSSWKPEALFLAITVAATGVHLIGMNYGFFCHASAFYSAPVMVAISFVGFACVLNSFALYRFAMAAFMLLPAVAIVLALRPFSPEVPVDKLPVWLRDPAIAISTISGVTWWFGYQRHRHRLLLHSGCVALAFAALRVLHGPIDATVVIESMKVPVLAYGFAVYFMVMAWMLGSRLEALAATGIQFVATAVMVYQQSAASGLIVSLAAGWSAWLAVHLLFRRPMWFVRIAPVAFLAIFPWTFDVTPMYRDQIAMHSAVLVVVLLVAGQIWRWTRYRSVAVLVAAGHGLAFGAGRTLHSARLEAVLLVLAGFAVLAIGAMISWHKSVLLNAMMRKEDYIEPEPPTI